MSEKQEAIERLQALELRSGGSHEMLSSIAKAIYEPTHGGWTIGACQVLRDTLVRLLSETDTAPSGVSITDELCEYVSTADRDVYTGKLLAIADRIDAAHEEAMQREHESAYDAGYAEHEDAMAEHGWVRLPKDADGEYIHIGDRMENNERVARIVLTDGSWEPSVYLSKLPNFLHERFCHEISHYHGPTVEDVLHSFICDVEEDVRDEREIIAEYAAKLRLAGDAE